MPRAGVRGAAVSCRRSAGSWRGPDGTPGGPRGATARDGGYASASDGRSRLLARQARAADRQHGLQGGVARALARRARRRRARLQRRRADDALAARAGAARGARAVDRAPTCATRTRSTPRSATRVPRSSSTWPRSRWCGARSRDPRETFETNVMGTVNVLDAVRARRRRARRRQRHVRQVLRQPRAGPAVPRGRPEGRARSVLELEGLRGARRRRLPALVLRARRRRAAAGLRARRQRDRRRRLGRGPARAGHHARRAGR